MNTAIIGLGNIGSRLAQNLTAGGESIMVADKTLAKAEQLAGELGSNAKAMSIPEAMGEADVVILTIYFDAIKDMLMTYRSDVAGKIIVDPSNRLRRMARAASRRQSRQTNHRDSSSPHFFRKGQNSLKRSAHWAQRPWRPASTVRRSAPCCSMQQIIQRLAELLPSSSPQAAFRLSASVGLINPFASRWVAICTSSASSAGWSPPRRRHHLSDAARPLTTISNQNRTALSSPCSSPMD